MTLSLDDVHAVVRSPGVYSFPQAAEVLMRESGASINTIRSWWRRGLTQPEASEIPELLTFHDLVSLEVVGRFRRAGVSLQKVRQLEAKLNERLPALDRPFAHKLFFTDGAAIWVELNGATEEIIGEHENQLVFHEAIATFAREIRYVDDTASAWDVSPMVELDPRVNFGQPVIRGTRIQVSTVLKQLDEVGPIEVADMYSLSEVQINGVLDYRAAA